jgi:hypothetical protein
MTEAATRKDRKEQRKPADDLTPLLPAVVVPVLIDVPPATASTPVPDPAPGWDGGFGGGDLGGGGGGGDF